MTNLRVIVLPGHNSNRVNESDCNSPVSQAWPRERKLIRCGKFGADPGRWRR